MPGRKIILALCLICFVSSGSRAQQRAPSPAKPASDTSRAPQPVPPPPKPADDGPSLEVTMKFIQERMSSIGPLRWAIIDRDQDDVEYQTSEVSNVVADPRRCSITYDSKFSIGTGVEPNRRHIVVNLENVEEITVVSYQQGWDAQGNTRYKFSPPMFAVAFHQKYKGEAASFDVDDEKLANRLARAVTHAVELCTADKKPEPF